MKETKNLKLIEHKNVPQEEPARQYYFMDIAKDYVAQLAVQK